MENNAAWKVIVAKYQKPSRWRAAWQIMDTIAPYALLWYLFQEVKPITLLSSLKSFTFRLWDEKHKQLVGYHQLRKLREPKVPPPEV